MRATYNTGDWVVFRKTKFSERPTDRAVEVTPCPNGDGYTYQVDKFWVVESVRPDGRVVVRTRRGKRHEIDADDRRFRHASLWDRVVHRGRFHETSDQLNTPSMSEAAVA